VQNGSELAVEGVMRTSIDHIKKLEEQNELMLAALKRITKYTKWLAAEADFLEYGRKISIEERDLHGSWHDAIHESCGAIAYVEVEEE
jgi:hypothetical protein